MDHFDISKGKDSKRKHHKASKRCKGNKHQTSKVCILLQSSHALGPCWLGKGKRSQRQRCLTIYTRDYCNNKTLPANDLHNLFFLADAAIIELEGIIEYDDNDKYYGNAREIKYGCEMGTTEGKTPCFANSTMKSSDKMLSEEGPVAAGILLSFNNRQCSQKLLPSTSVGSDAGLENILLNGSSTTKTQQRKRVYNTNNHEFDSSTQRNEDDGLNTKDPVKFGTIALQDLIQQNGNLSDVKEIKNAEFDKGVLNNAPEIMKASNQSMDNREAECIALAEWIQAVDMQGLLFEELGRLHKDIIGTQNSSSPITHLDEFKRLYTAVFKKLSNVIKQADSAQKKLKVRNKCISDISFKLSEIIENLSKIAEVMVDGAFQEEDSLTNSKLLPQAISRCVTASLAIKDLLFEELGRLRKDNIETKNNSSPITDLDEFRQLFASVVQDLRNAVIKQAYSAPKETKRRNKYTMIYHSRYKKSLRA